jgi:hypothetical protein
MNVTGNAFYFGKEADRADVKFEKFFLWLAERPTQHWPPHKPDEAAYAYKREIFTNVLDDYFCGVIISARRSDYHHYVKRKGASVSIETKGVGPNPPVEINFFCLRRDSSRGIYSHHFGSYSFNSFLKDLWGAYRYFVDAKKKVAFEALEEAHAPGIVAARKELAAGYSLSKRAVYSPLCNPEEFEKLVGALSVVTEVRLTSYNVDAPSDTPVKDRIKSVHAVYKLVKDQPPTHALIDWVKSKREDAKKYLKHGKVSQSGSVIGKNANGVTVPVDFELTFDDVLHFPHKEIGRFDVDKLTKNKCVKAMIGVLTTNILFSPVDA